MRRAAHSKKGTKPVVLFTGFTGVVASAMTQVVSNLGGNVTTVPSECTHLVADKVRRTEKFLCAFNTCKYVLHYAWVDQSQNASKLLDENAFVLKDTAAEEKYRFSLTESLKSALTHGLLTGYKVWSTASVVPKQQELSNIVLSAGGEMLNRPPETFHQETLIVSDAKDEAGFPFFTGLGYTVHRNEVILTGVLRQQLDLSEFILAAPEPAEERKAPAPKKTVEASSAVLHAIVAPSTGLLTLLRPGAHLGVWLCPACNTGRHREP